MLKDDKLLHTGVQHRSREDASLQDSGGSRVGAGWLFASEQSNSTAGGAGSPYSTSDSDDIAAAVQKASGAQPAWAYTAPSERGTVLRKVASGLRAAVDELARIMGDEEGKIGSEASAEVLNAANVMEYYAGLTMHGGGAIVPSNQVSRLVYTLAEPLGVIAAITPWNFPINAPILKIAPALAAGNAVVLKPSPVVPASTMRLCKIIHEAGVPDGVLTVVFGGQEVGERLVLDPTIAGVSFTGSTLAGRRIAQLCAQRGVPAQCEMGGKNTLVVLADGSLNLAVTLAIEGGLSGSGQKCTASSVILVEKAVAGEFKRLLRKGLEDRFGHGGSLASLATAGQSSKAIEAVRDALGSGASTLYGPGAPGASAPNGREFPPWFLADVTPQMSVASEELFAPVVCLIEVGGFLEAIQLINASRYGLAAAIVTRSLSVAHTFATSVQVGAVAINAATTGWEYQAPFGGWRDSGYGGPEQGERGLAFYTKHKTVSVNWASE